MENNILEKAKEQSFLSQYNIDERYQLTWPGKKEAIVLANTPTTKTLRPVREKSVDFENTKNIYIEGDNLEALKILQESYLNKIKCIYIDPPYNTGSAFEYYEDGLEHSEWLCMMKPRLEILHKLLSEDGSIWIQIDDEEQACFFFSDGHWFIEDRSRDNSTYVHAGAGIKLEPGDIIRMGDREFVFSIKTRKK